MKTLWLFILLLGASFSTFAQESKTHYSLREDGRLEVQDVSGKSLNEATNLILDSMKFKLNQSSRYIVVSNLPTYGGLEIQLNCFYITTKSGVRTGVACASNLDYSYSYGIVNAALDLVVGSSVNEVSESLYEDFVNATTEDELSKIVELMGSNITMSKDILCRNTGGATTKKE